MTYYVVQQADFTPALLQTMFDLITSGGQVHLEEAILKKNIANCIAIAYCVDEQTVAIAAIKTPQKSYKRKVFEKAGVTDAQLRFVYEVGYCVTLPEYKGKGICQQLITKLMQVSRCNLFGTTKTPAMKKVFTRLAYEEFGDPYPQNQESSECDYIQLFVYDKY